MSNLNDNSCLFDYLRQIIYTPEKASLDRSALTPSEEKIADGLDILLRFVLENNQFSHDLTNGVINQARVPSRENVMAGSLKAVHSMLSHLIWLMNEVAGGDYKQRLNLANDLSRSFNAMVEYLVELSLQDKLTGLANENGFMEKAARLIQQAQPDESYFIVSANVNDFKHFNALYSSEKGDELLRHIAGYLLGICHEGELCARFHADHYFCLLKGKDAEEVAKRINIKNTKMWLGVTSRAYLFRSGIYAVHDTDIPIRSMCERASFATESIHHAASRSFAVFNTQMEEQFALQESPLASYKNAIDNEEFEVYYQPKNDTQTGEIVSCEALVRWISPQGEVMLPDQFIKLFESNGLITSLDFYVLEHVCRYLRERMDKGERVIPAAVNFSRIHLLDANFVQHLLSVLHTYHIEPRWIEVEITETAFFERIGDMMAMVNELHRAGFTIAMDDFGTGFSSLYFLRTIPLDVIKIDRLFFTDFDTDDRTKLLLEDILTIAHHLRLKTVAEGIECKEEVDFLKEKGCDIIQGFYYYHPMKKQELATVL